MADATTQETLVFVKQLAGAEDLMFGTGTTSQVREGQTVTLSLINADTIPYDSTRSVKDVLDELLLRVQ
ncbi:MAG: hypothetical protein JHC33_11390 [Ignisphaera sp.]|nr:hypothetical protein [Ignisphaera sp.]